MNFKYDTSNPTWAHHLLRPSLLIFLGICLAFLSVPITKATEGESGEDSVAIVYKLESDPHLYIHDSETGTQKVDMEGRSFLWKSGKSFTPSNHGPAFFSYYVTPGSDIPKFGGFSNNRKLGKLVPFFQPEIRRMDDTTINTLVSDGAGNLIFLGIDPGDEKQNNFIPYISDGSFEGTRPIGSHPGNQFATLRTGGGVGLISTDREGRFNLYSADFRKRTLSRHLHGSLKKNSNISVETSSDDYIPDQPGLDRRPFVSGRATFQFGGGFATLLAGGKIAFTRFTGEADASTAAVPVVRTLPQGLRLDPEEAPAYANDRLFFSATLAGTTSGRGLFYVEKTGEVTSVPNVTNPRSLSPSGNRLFFAGGNYPMVWNGTSAESLRLSETEYYRWKSISAAGGRAFFISAREVLRSDGTFEGTSIAPKFNEIGSVQLDQSGRVLYVCGRIGSGESAQFGIWSIDVEGGSARLAAQFLGLSPHTIGLSAIRFALF